MNVPLFPLTRRKTVVRVLPRFPGRVDAGDGVSITKANGVYTFALDFASLVPIGTAAVTDYMAVLRADGSYAKILAQDLASVGTVTSFIDLDDVPASYVGQALKGVRVNAGETALEFFVSSSAAPNYREITAAGAVTITVADDIVGINKTVGAATSVNLGTAAARTGKILIIKDVKKDADVNNITPVASGGELIDGLAASAWAIVSPGDSLKLLPISGGWLTVP